MSTKPYNVFISWSGDRSKHIALGLRDWLPAILQSAKPWMSEYDIDKGTRAVEEIGKALSDIKVGIVCLTPENMESRWILFEAGALSRTIDIKTRLCTYLLGGLEPKVILQPLGIFQATRSTKADTRQLIRTINVAINDEPLAENVVDMLFDSLWPQLESVILSMPVKKAPVKRSLEDMMEEMLGMMRSEQTRSEMLTEVMTFVRGEIAERQKMAAFMRVYDDAVRKVISTPVKGYFSEEAWEKAKPECPSCGSLLWGHLSTGERQCKCGATERRQEFSE